MRATVCPTCAQLFPNDAKFCPFDGESLVFSDSSDISGEALLGSTIDGRYEVERIVGEGGMGTVYAVRHLVLGKRFALKLLRPEIAAESDTALRFIQEARTAAAVSHPGLVEITDFGALPSGQAYFVMELLDGVSLNTLLRHKGQLEVRRIVEIARQCAEALHALHTRGIVHRDLKPDNIHVGTNDGWGDRVKIVDFGLARVMGASRLTRNGVVYGTPYYMSPEQAAGDPFDHRADIYALGVVMYEMLTGRVPFEADSYMGVLTKHRKTPPIPPTELVGKLGLVEPLERIILRCLEKNPANRYSSLIELSDELGRVAVRRSNEGSQGRSVFSVELPSRGGSESEKRRGGNWWRGAVVAAAIGACVVVLALAVQPSRQHGVADTIPTRSTPVAAIQPTVVAPRLPLVADSEVRELAANTPSSAASTCVQPSPSAQSQQAVGNSKIGKRTQPKAVSTPKAVASEPLPAASDMMYPWAK
jgi:serine/threonine-protein kinase